MDAYFPDDEEETGVADAPVDASGAFALSDVQAPTGGFQFVSVDDQDSASCGIRAHHLLWAIFTGQHVVRRTTAAALYLAFSFYTATGDTASPCAPRLVILLRLGSLSGRSFNPFGHLSTFSSPRTCFGDTLCKNSTPFCLGLGLASPLPPVPEPALLCASPFPSPPSPSHGFPSSRLLSLHAASPVI